jgi:hypothetical protein
MNLKLIKSNVMATVKNLHGTRGKSCKCSTWKRHWLICSGASWPKYCINRDCRNPPTLGGHVKKVDIDDNDHYIIPICASCNKLEDQYEVSNIYFVSANKSETCEQDLKISQTIFTS